MDLVNRLRGVTVQPIRLFGDPVLRTPAEPVTDFDKELRTLVADLAETDAATRPGAGLAAPQIGVGLRVFTYHVDDEQSGHLVNPVLHFPDEDEQDGPEGCLSIPGLSFDCRRRAHVVAHGQNMYGDPVTRRGHRDCSPAASSTRPTTSTACCSSTGWTPRPARLRHAGDPRGRVVPGRATAGVKVSPHATHGSALRR